VAALERPKRSGLNARKHGAFRPKSIVRFYNGRGTCEQWIKEGKRAPDWTRPSCHEFKNNVVRLALFVLAYNLGNFLRRVVLPAEIAR